MGTNATFPFAADGDLEDKTLEIMDAIEKNKLRMKELTGSNPQLAKQVEALDWDELKTAVEECIFNKDETSLPENYGPGLGVDPVRALGGGGGREGLDRPARDLLQMECAKETFLRICHSEVVPGADAKVQVKRNLADHNGSVLGLPGLFQGLDYLNAQSVSLNRKSMLVIARVFHLR